MTNDSVMTYVFFLDGALLAIVCIRYTGTSTNHTAPLVGSIIAFVTNPDQRCRSHIRVTDYTFTITYGDGETQCEEHHHIRVGTRNTVTPLTLFTQATNSNAGLLAAHDQVRVMLRHDADK